MPKKTFDVATLQSSIVIGNPSSRELSESNWRSATKQHFRPRENSSRVARVKKDPNVSQLNFGEGCSFQSETSEVHCLARSVKSSEYSRRKPAPGFDRLTSNKTNYDLGRDDVRYSTANMRATADPKTLPVQSGPKYPSVAERDYNPHNCAGYKHNLLNSRKDPYAGARPLPGKFGQGFDKDIYGSLVGMSDSTKRYNIIQGRTKEGPKAPPKKADLDRNVRPPLDSLLSLRPPLASDKARR